MPQSEIAVLDRQRCNALIAGDVAALRRLLSDDLVHIHANGLREDKAAYLQTVSDALTFVAIDNRIMKERSYGDIVVLDCDLRQTVLIKATGSEVQMAAALTLVWKRSISEWQLCSFQATNII